MEMIFVIIIETIMHRNYNQNLNLNHNGEEYHHQDTRIIIH